MMKMMRVPRMMMKVVLEVKNPPKVVREVKKMLLH
jgi:hypothetical protein